jgi:alkyl hydroperoxide reductase subunit F
VYAGRKKLNTLVIKAAWGGQSVVSPDIHNWIGTKSISGEKLAKDLQEHVEAYKSDIFEIVTGEVVKVEGASPLFTVTTKEGNVYQAKTVLITAGSSRKELDIPGAKEFEHKGLTYCASCDGLFFADMDVVVVGAGNAGFESALQLSAYCKSVTILIRGENIRADELTVEAAKRDPKVKLMFNTVPVEVLGERTVTGIKVRLTPTLSNGEGEVPREQVLDVKGIFVEIGQIPNTVMVSNLVKIDKIGKIEIDPWTGRTSVPGVWAAGDCTNIKYHQNNIAVGEGVKALEDIYQFIKRSS